MFHPRVAPLLWSVLVCLLAASACSPSRPPGPRWPTPLSQDAYSAYLRGRMAMHEGNHMAAVLHLRSASTAAPDEMFVQLAYIEALRKAGRSEDATAHAARTRDRWPKEPDTWLALGSIYSDDRSRAGQRRAARAFKRAMKLDPWREAGYLGLAQAQKRLGRARAATKTYRRLLEWSPSSIEGLYGHALQLMDAGRHRDAIPKLDRLLSIRFSHLRGYRALARALRFTGDDARAVAILREAFDRSGDLTTGTQLFYQLLATGEHAQATILATSMDTRDADEDTLLELGQLHLATGNWDAAEHLAQRTIDREPTSGLGEILRARALAGQRRPAEAVDRLLAVSEEQAAYVEARALASAVLADQGQAERALQVIADPLARFPSHSSAVIAHARAQAAAGRPERARSALQAALVRKPRALDLMMALADLERRERKPAAQRALLERVLKQEPGHAPALAALGSALMIGGKDLTRAERLLLRAVMEAPGDAQVLGRLGWLRFQQRRNQDARQTLERAVAIFDQDPELLWYLGEVCLVQRERERGLGFLRRALSLGPTPTLRARIEARLQATTARATP